MGTFAREAKEPSLEFVKATGLEFMKNSKLLLDVLEAVGNIHPFIQGLTTALSSPFRAH